MATNTSADPKMIKLMEELTRKSNNAEKSVGKVSKEFQKLKSNIEGLEDPTDNFLKSLSKMNKESKNLGQQVKILEKVSKAFDDINEVVTDNNKLMNELGVSSSKVFSAISKKAVEIQDTLANLSSKSSGLASFKSKLEEMPELFKIFSSKGKTSLDDLKGSLNSLKNTMPEEDFEKFKKSIEGLSESDVSGISSAFADLRKMGLSDLKQSLNELKESSAFKDLSKEGQKEFSNLFAEVARGALTHEQALQRLNKLNASLGPELADSMKTANSATEDHLNKLDRVKKELEDFKDRFSQAELFQMNLGDMTAGARDLVRQISLVATNTDLDMSDFSSELDEISQVMSDINEIQQDKQKLDEKIASMTEEELKNNTTIAKQEKAILASLSDQSNKLRDIENNTQSYMKSAEKIANLKYGNNKANQLAESFYDASNFLKMANKRGGLLGGTLGRLAPMAKGLGAAMSAVALPLTVLTAVVSIIKLIAEAESKVADWNKGMVESRMIGVGMGKDIGEQFKEVGNKIINAQGLADALMGKDFAIGAKDITQTVAALEEAGIRSETLSKKMKGVETTTAASGNEYLKASQMVETFALSMKLSSQQTASLMGDMAFEYGTSMGQVRDTFNEISNAAQRSGMGTSKFLGIMSSAVTGVNMYQTQVSEAADFVAKLGENSKNSAKEIQGVVGAVNEFSSDMEKVVMALRGLTKEQRKSFMGGIGDSVTSLEKDRQKQLDDLKKTKEYEKATAEERKKIEEDVTKKIDIQISKRKRLMKLIKEGRDVDAAKLLPIVGSMQTQGQLAGFAQQRAEKMGGDSEFAYLEIAKVLGNEKLAELSISGTTAIKDMTERIEKGLKELKPKEGEKDKDGPTKESTFIQKMDEAIQAYNKTQPVLKKIEDAAVQTLKQKGSELGNPLTDDVEKGWGAMIMDPFLNMFGGEWDSKKGKMIPQRLDKDQEQFFMDRKRHKDMKFNRQFTPRVQPNNDIRSMKEVGGGSKVINAKFETNNYGGDKAQMLEHGRTQQANLENILKDS